MVHFEFGRGGLAQAHLLKAFELLQGAIKGAFVLFSRTLLGLVGFVLQNHSLSFPTPSSGSSKARLSLEAEFSPCFSGCPAFSSAGCLAGSAAIEAADSSRAFRAA